MSNVEAVKDVLVSNNGMVKEGMKVSEANSEPQTMSVFNFADKDGDGVISKAEAERYMSPILFSCSHGETVLNSEIKENYKPCPDAVEIFAGQKIEDVQPKGRELYTLVDVNHDNKISKEEMEQIRDAVNKASQYREQCCVNSSKAKVFGAFGALFGFVGGFLTYGGISGLIYNAKIALTKEAVAFKKWGMEASMMLHNSKINVKDLLTKNLPIGLSVLGIGGFLLYLGYKACKSNNEMSLGDNPHPYLKAKLGTIN